MFSVYCVFQVLIVNDTQIDALVAIRETEEAAKRECEQRAQESGGKEIFKWQTWNVQQ